MQAYITQTQVCTRPDCCFRDFVSYRFFIASFLFVWNGRPGSYIWDITKKWIHSVSAEITTAKI